MKFLALRALLSRVPSIAWVGVGVVWLLAAAAYGLYHHGERAGEVKVHTLALRDSTVHQRATVDTVARAADVAVVLATNARHVSSVGRVQTRAVLEANRDTIPPKSWRP